MKATCALLSFARDKRSRDTVEGLLLEMVVLPAKMKKSKIKPTTESSELDLSVSLESDGAVDTAQTDIETDKDTVRAENITKKKPKSKSESKRTQELSPSEGSSSREEGREMDSEAMSLSSEARHEGGEEKEEEGEEKEDMVLPMDGWCVVFTGKLSTQSRAQAEQTCVALGESSQGKGRKGRQGNGREVKGRLGSGG